MREVAIRNSVDQISLIYEKEGLVRNLSGFKKNHRVPDSSSSRDKSFVAQVAEPQIDDELERVFSALRSLFGFKRKEVVVSGPEEGFGAITTPRFSFSICVSQLEDAPDSYHERQCVTEINDPESSLGKEFEEIFGNRFFTLEVIAKQQFDIEGIIDRVEDGGSAIASIDYDRNATWCQIDIRGIQVHVSENIVKIVDLQRQHKAKELFAAFATIQQQFLDMLC